MVWLLGDYLCCFKCPPQQSQQDEEPTVDETTHLIPQAPDYDLYEASLMNQRRLDERLGSIVRAKEGKMVNIASQIPFNLHNRVLLEESFTNSRSGSRSVDIYNTHGYEDGSDSRRRRRRRSSHFSPLTPLGSRPASVYGEVVYTRASSPDSAYRQAMHREPILNVRLVGYSPPSRGRSIQRSSHDSVTTRPPENIKPVNGETAGSVGSSISPIVLTPRSESHHFQIESAGLICTSWDD
ncbi:hypothetical protein AX17_006100 [Amanita inopinata Kibby_2008]|nr:hypothetical protein AX17_006100 [Amanita inopinata Kibby_2008]